jgi:hypothetical protein
VNELLVLSIELLVGRSAGSNFVYGTLLELLDSLLSVEQRCGLLERAALGFDQELPDESELEDEPCNVNDVVLPFESAQRDRVDIPIETS